MNLENSANDDKDQLLTLKALRIQYQAEKNRNLRLKEIEEKRNKIEQISLFQNKANIELTQKLEALYKELSYVEKLRSSQNREIKQFLSEIRKISLSDQKLFIWIVESTILSLLLRLIIETKTFPFDLKHEALWIIAITSNLKVNPDKAYQFMKALIILAGDIYQLTKSNQIFFLQKIIASITNFIIEKNDLVSLIQNDRALQRAVLVLIEDHDVKNVTLSLWFIRITLKAGKIGFEEILSDGSLQHAFINTLKKYANEKDIVTELVWTLAHLSQIPCEYEILGNELIFLVMQVAVHYDEGILIPCLTVLGNSLTAMGSEGVLLFLQRTELNDILKIGLVSNNFVVKRETLFLLSNLAANSEVSAEFILQKKDLVEFLIQIIINNEPYVYKEALYILSNLASISESKYLGYMKENFPEISKIYDSLVNHQSAEEIQMLQEKLLSAFSS